MWNTYKTKPSTQKKFYTQFSSQLNEQEVQYNNEQKYLNTTYCLIIQYGYLEYR